MTPLPRPGHPHWRVQTKETPSASAWTTRQHRAVEPPEPFYGVSGHAWSALALAVAVADQAECSDDEGLRGT